MFARVRSQDNSEEYFFRTAKLLGDPVTGFEDADFWSVQALSLMAVYMLAVSKRNAAYAYFGMLSPPPGHADANTLLQVWPFDLPLRSGSIEFTRTMPSFRMMASDCGGTFGEAFLSSTSFSRHLLAALQQLRKKNAPRMRFSSWRREAKVSTGSSSLCQMLRAGLTLLCAAARSLASS